MIFTFPILISLIPAGVALIIVFSGTILWKWVSRGLGIATIGTGLLFAILFGPMIFMDKVELSDEQIQQSTGFWFNQTVKGFQIYGLNRVLIVIEPDRNNRFKELWITEYTSGKRIKVDPGDLWESNGDEIVEYMTDRGIVVVRE